MESKDGTRYSLVSTTTFLLRFQQNYKLKREKFNASKLEKFSDYVM